MTDPHTPRPPRAQPPRIALAHDWLVAFRGGEAVLESIARVAHNRAQPARLYTMFAPAGILDRLGRRGPGPDALRAWGNPRCSWLNAIPGADGALRRWLLPLYPAAVADLSRQLARDHAVAPISLLISTSSAAVKGLKPPANVPHLCYCHAPARYLWSQPSEYRRGRAGRLREFGLGLFGRSLREWDRRTAAHVTRFLANSTHTAAEIRRCYGRESTVVFPPVNISFYTPDQAVPRGDHWLYAGALEPYKRVELVIQAANLARHPLVIVGDGSQAAHLRSLAGASVRFLGRIDDEALRHEYRSARLLIFPQIEDFGIVAVEAHACGTPVLAFRAGGALDTVVDGHTGALFDHPSPDAIIAAAAGTPAPSAAISAACRANAERFGEDRFLAEIGSHVDELLAASGPD
jgi:glycosyltransferase involved in cell wall biosynthesis